MARLETRLNRLEAVAGRRQSLAVLLADDGREADAVNSYRSCTPEAERADHVVVIRKFCVPAPQPLGLALVGV